MATVNFNIDLNALAKDLVELSATMRKHLQGANKDGILSLRQSFSIAQYRQTLSVLDPEGADLLAGRDYRLLLTMLIDITESIGTVKGAPPEATGVTRLIAAVAGHYKPSDNTAAAKAIALTREEKSFARAVDRKLQSALSRAQKELELKRLKAMEERSRASNGDVADLCAEPGSVLKELQGHAAHAP
ncbi:hypothetical protein AURDEDRAFT_160142 [Auricularia subglabra TFB-10046 SS5]|nr:hypothetical protein AURDEDRAFT_160142 [Auricularia subglabra TFB-10046 SS5]